MKKIIISLGIFIQLIFLLLSKSGYADGFITVQHPYPGTPFPLVVKYHHVEVEIYGQAATTLIDQEFYNPTAYRLEGYYLFPVPRGAAFKKFSMYIDGKEVPAELLDAKKARKIYEDIVRTQLDPAILEYEGLDIFKARIFPIEPKSKKRIKIAYNEILNKDNGTIEYLYPLNTEKLSSKQLEDVAIKVNINSGEEIKNIYCTSHETGIIRKGKNKAFINYSAKNVKPDADFRLYYSVDKSKLGISLLTCREEGKNGYFILSASPGFNVNENYISQKDITFVLDVSGSMIGEKLEQAKKAIQFCIGKLRAGDRFQIIRFSTDVEALFAEPSIADKKNLNKAKSFVSDLRATGGTNIDAALGLALSAKPDNSRPHIIIFITDGKPTIGETDEEKLLQKIRSANISNIRIFTFGIGYDINTHLLDRITELTRAYRTYISPRENIELAISNFYNKVKSPVLTDIKLSFSENVRIFLTYPKDIPDMFSDSSLTLLGQYSGSGMVKVILEGKLRDSGRRFEYDAIFPGKNDGNDFIPALWAARRIGFLLDRIRLYGESKQYAEEIIRLARQHGIVTPYTSYLIVEDEAGRVERGELDEKHQTIGAIVPRADDFAQRNKKEYLQMRSKSGISGVQASKELQELNIAVNAGQLRQGSDRLNYKDNSGKEINLNSRVKNVQGRAVYNSGKYWTDSLVQEKKWSSAMRIRFASPEYFDLLKMKPGSSKFLSVGKNVKFVLNDILYEIYE